MQRLPFKSICLQSMSKEDFDLYMKAYIQKSYSKGDIIFKQDDKSLNLVFLQSGIVKFNFTDENNKILS